MSKSVIVYSNDPKQKTYALKLDGTVEVLAAFAPNRLNLNRVPIGATLERLVRVEGKLADKVKLSKVRSSSKQIAATVTHDDSNRPALAVKVTAGNKEQRISGTVRVATGLKEPKELMLFIWGMASRDVVLERSYLFFPQPRGKRPPVVQVGIRSLSGKPFKVLKIVDPAGAVTGKMLHGGKPRLELKLKKKPKTAANKLKIYLDRKDQKVLEVRYGLRHAFTFNNRRRMKRIKRRILHAK